MKRIFLLILIFICFNLLAQAQLQVTYYVLADQNDWQLFMSKKLSSEIAAGGKVVLITLTAGDEGYGNSAFGSSTLPYYSAKEKGAIYSSKFVHDFSNPPIPPFNSTYPVPTAQTVSLGGKSLIKYYYGYPSGIGSVVNYFLRIPDGGPTGAGFSGTNNKSLKKLKEGTIPNITSVDGINTYTWSELVNTIFQIIFAEKGLDLQVWLNTGSSNIGTYPLEHSDHIFSAMAAQEAVATRLWVGKNEFVMDYSSSLPANLTNEEYERATAAFGNYNWSLIKEKYASQLNSTIRAWLPMESFSITRPPSGNAPLPITLLNFTGTLKGKNVLLEWSTSAEINSKEFQIEKSNDGVTYRKLNTVPAAGNSSILKKYNYLDIEATELNYYKLKMLDLDGSSKLSNVVIVKNNGLTQTISAVSNPFKDYISIRFSKIPKGGVTLKLIDLSGRLISTSEVYNPLSSVIHFDYNKSLSKGIYILQAENEGKQYSIKLLKE